MSDSDPQQEKQVTVSPIDIPELSAGGIPAKNMEIGFLRDVPVTISIELGRVQMTIEEILLLGTGSMVMLKKQINEPIDLLVNGRLVGHGEIVAIDEYFGIRITEITESAL